MRKTRILIADGDAAVAGTLATYVARLGYEVTAAVTGGAEAIAAVSADVPDVALIDLHMRGDMSGLELSAELPGVPVVFMSAAPDAECLEVAKRNGAYALLPKPFLAEDLRVAMRAALGRAGIERIAT